MRESPESVVTLLCSGIQLYSAERRIANCILDDVRWASVVTSAELAKASRSSEATVTRLCHKLGFDNYRMFQLALARDVMDQQENEKHKPRKNSDQLRHSLSAFQSNRQEEIRATVQALNLQEVRKIMSLLRSAPLIEIESSGGCRPVAVDAALKLSSLGKRCMSSPVPERMQVLASSLTGEDVMIVIAGSGRNEILERSAKAAREKGASVILISSDKRSPLAAIADYQLISTNRAQRLLDGGESLVGAAILVEMLYYLLRTGADLTEETT